MNIRILLAFSFCLLATTHFAYADKLRVAVIAPLSGDAAGYGTSVRDGMKLAYEQWPDNLRNEVELLFEDDQMHVKNSLAAFNRLRDTKGFDVLVSVTSGTSNALAKLAEEAKIPLLAIASDKKISESRSYAMNIFLRPEDQAALTVQEMKRRAYKTVARFTTTQDGCFALRDALDRANSDSHTSFPIDMDFPLDTKDLKPFAMQVRAKKNIDAISAICLPGHCGLLARQLREVGVTQPLFGFHMFEDPREVEQSAGALVGQWYVGSRNPDKDFLSEFEQRFGKASVLWCATAAHDAANLVRAGIEKGYKDSASLNQYFHQVSGLKGVLGSVTASNDNRLIIPVEVKEVTEEGFRAVDSKQLAVNGKQ